MNAGKFTLQAQVLWGAIPSAAKKRILANVFCGKCGSSRPIVNFTGNVEAHGDLILRGSCAVCGHDVVRLLETSEIRVQNN